MAEKGTQEPLEPEPITPEPPYSIYPKWKRMVLVYIASVAAFASPISSSIYFPAMLELAKDLNTTLTKIGLTVTTYMVNVFCIIMGIEPHNSRIGVPRCYANYSRRDVRSNWSTACLSRLVFSSNRCQHRTRSAKKLCRLTYSTLLAELWKQWNGCFIKCHSLRCCHSAGER
jgi:hypothetical protein